MPSADPSRPIVSPCLNEYTKDGYVTVRQFTWKTACIDILTGLAAPIVVSPFVAVVDWAIINKVNGTGEPIFPKIKEGFTKPWIYVTNPRLRYVTGLCWMVYAGTYASTNVTISYIEANKLTDADTPKASYLKVGVAAAVNMSLTVIKDVRMVKLAAQVAKEFGKPVQKELIMPYFARCFILVRDMLTMVAAFYLADEFGSRFYRMTQYKTAEGEKKDSISAANARQIVNLALPSAIQPLSTIFHLYALNYSANPSAGFSAHCQGIRNDYSRSVASRMLRILPAVGVGNNLKNNYRDWAFRYAEKRQLI